MGQTGRIWSVSLFHFLVLALTPGSSPSCEGGVLLGETSPSGCVSEGPEPRLFHFVCFFTKSTPPSPTFSLKESAKFKGAGVLPQYSPISFHVIATVALPTAAASPAAAADPRSRRSALGVPALEVVNFADSVGGSDTKVWNFVLRPVTKATASFKTHRRAQPWNWLTTSNFSRSVLPTETRRKNVSNFF